MEARNSCLFIGEMAERKKTAASKAIIPYELEIGDSNRSFTIKTLGL